MRASSSEGSGGGSVHACIVQAGRGCPEPMLLDWPSAPARVSCSMARIEVIPDDAWDGALGELIRGLWIRSMAGSTASLQCTR